MSSSVKFKKYNFYIRPIGKFAMLASEIMIENVGYGKGNFEPFFKRLTIGHGYQTGTGVTIISSNLHTVNNAIFDASELLISSIPDSAAAVGLALKLLYFEIFLIKLGN